MLVAIVLGGLLMVYPTYRDTNRLKERQVELKAQIEAKEKELAKIEQNKNRFRNDPDFLESIARQNRRVFPGELVFIFKD